MNDIHIDEFSWDRLPELGDFVQLINVTNRQVLLFNGCVVSISDDGSTMKLSGGSAPDKPTYSRTLHSPSQKEYRWGIRVVHRDYREDQPQENDDDI